MDKIDNPIKAKAAQAREAARAQQVAMWLRMIAAQPDDIRVALGRGDK